MSKLSIISNDMVQTVIPYTKLKGIESLSNGVKFTLKDDTEIIVKGTTPTNDYVKVTHKLQADWLKNKPTGIMSCEETYKGRQVTSVWYDTEPFN